MIEEKQENKKQLSVYWKDEVHFFEQIETAAYIIVGGCAVFCHVGAKGGYFEK